MRGSARQKATSCDEWHSVRTVVWCAMASSLLCERHHVGFGDAGDLLEVFVEGDFAVHASAVPGHGALKEVG